MQHEQFSRETRTRCANHGIDIDDSYAALQLDVRLGGGIYHRLLHTFSGRPRKNSVLDRIDGADKRVREAGRPSRARQPRTQTLTRCEIETLALMAEGGSSKTIAARTGVRQDTVRKRLILIIRKLNAKNTTNAVAVAIRRGMI